MVLELHGKYELTQIDPSFQLQLSLWNTLRSSSCQLHILSSLVVNFCIIFILYSKYSEWGIFGLTSILHNSVLQYTAIKSKKGNKTLTWSSWFDPATCLQQHTHTHKYIFSFSTTNITYYTRSSATAEKQRVSCQHGGGYALQPTPLHHPYTYAYGRIRNLQQTYVKRTIH